MDVRNFEQHPNWLEQGIATSDESIFVICAHYVPHGELTDFKDDRAFYCARLPNEIQEQCYPRASELVREHKASTSGPHCGNLLIADCEETRQKDWEEQAPAVAAYRRELRL